MADMKEKRMAERAYYRKSRSMSMGDGEVGYSDPRRRHELEDMQMISEDSRAVANLPQNVIMKDYDKTGPWNDEVMDDTIKGIEYQIDRDSKVRSRITNPRKV